MSTVSKIIDILDPQAGTIKESVRETPEGSAPETGRNLFESKRNGRPITLAEAATTSDFPIVLRDGIRSIAFDAYAGIQPVWPEICMMMPSDRPAEDWAEENAIGELPPVGEGQPYPSFKLDLDRSVRIPNVKYGGFIEVTEEMIRFNRTNLIKRQAAQLGRAAVRTQEVATFAVLTTAGNYVRADTTGDNDLAANTAATVFSASGLNTALNVLRTMKDRKSGVYLGVNPDTLIVTPALEVAAKQLLMAPVLQRASASTTQEIYGTGGANPFRGMVNRIIVTPYMGASYQWCLMEAKQACVMQEVEGLQILTQEVNRAENEGYFNYDLVKFRSRIWFGCGMLNDRYAYYSSATSATVT